MTVYQQTFDIPPEILNKVLTGEYKVYGGIVRYAKGKKGGQIVKHLKEAKLDDAIQPKKLADSLKIVVKEHKKPIIVGGAIIAAAVGTGCYFINRKKDKIKLSEEDKIIIERFDQSFNAYISALKKGTMTEDLLLEFDEAFNNLYKKQKNNEISLNVKLNDMKSLVKYLSEYTRQLAKVNDVDLSDDEINLSNDVHVDLRNCLNVQKRVFLA